MSTEHERLLRLADHLPVVTTKDAIAAGIHTQALSRLVKTGELVRVARAQYALPGREITEHHGLALAAGAAPKGVICLLSALSFHHLGTQLPFDVWLAIDRRARAPSLAYPPLRVLRFGGAALDEGVEIHEIEGRSVRIFGIAKTIADAFKYRNKIGLDVALEALREAWHGRRIRLEDLDRFARICRVERVIRPYIESLVA